LEADADSRLPLDFDSSRRSMDRPDQMILGLQNRAFKASVKSVRVGLEIVNCVTLWFPKPYLKDQTYEKPVAVLSNNDRSVAIVDLERSEVLESLKLDDCVNRAVISPNGQLLIAIGDDPYMHVYQRKQQMGMHKSPIGSKSFKPEWVKCQRVQLQGQRLSDKSDMRGSFAAAFSPSGRYLAIGTQYGIISVFQTRCLSTPDEDPLIVTFTTSRPNQKAGAVRVLEFSPEPYDLLAWTENNGRAGVADIRRCFMSRQILITDPDAEGVDQVVIAERSDDLAIDPRLRQFQTDSDIDSPDSFVAQERRQPLQPEREVHSSHLEELAVLEAIQVDRRQRDRDAGRQVTTGTTQNGSSSTGSSDDARLAFWRENIGFRRNPTNTIPNSLREFISGRTRESLRNDSVIRNDSLRVYINERNQERERHQQPRRRGSVILAAAQSALDGDSIDAQRIAVGDLATGSNRVTPTPPRLPAIGSDSPHNPWADIGALYSLSGASPVDPTTRVRSEPDSDNRRDYTRRHQFTARIEYDEETSRARAMHSPDLGLSIPSDPLDTTGCCWGRDGKIL
jgi:hypothetical protein